MSDAMVRHPRPTPEMQSSNASAWQLRHDGNGSKFPGRADLSTRLQGLMASRPREPPCFKPHGFTPSHPAKKDGIVASRSSGTTRFYRLADRRVEKLMSVLSEIFCEKRLTP
jgi:hypothetical protein